MGLPMKGSKQREIRSDLVAMGSRGWGPGECLSIRGDKGVESY